MKYFLYGMFLLCCGLTLSNGQNNRKPYGQQHPNIYGQQPPNKSRYPMGCAYQRMYGNCYPSKTPFWYYNSYYNKCKKSWMFCRDSMYAFNSKWECKQTCTSQNNDACTLPMAVGKICPTCYSKYGCDGKRYYYNYRRGKCLPFFYYGCGGNINNYRSLLECECRCERDIYQNDYKLSQCRNLKMNRKK